MTGWIEEETKYLTRRPNHLAGIAITSTLIIVKLLQLIWRSGTRIWNVTWRVTYSICWDHELNRWISGQFYAVCWCYISDLTTVPDHVCIWGWFELHPKSLDENLPKMTIGVWRQYGMAHLDMEVTVYVNAGNIYEYTIILGICVHHVSDMAFHVMTVE